MSDTRFEFPAAGGTVKPHWRERIAERLSDALASQVADAILRLTAQLPPCERHGPDCGIAIRVLRDTVSHGTLLINADSTGPSNGDVLYAIVRNRRIATVMWRRNTQPETRDALRVHHIARIAA